MKALSKIPVVARGVPIRKRFDELTKSLVLPVAQKRSWTDLLNTDLCACGFERKEKAQGKK